MASLISSRGPGRARWIVSALLHTLLHSPEKAVVTTAEAAGPEVVSHRRHYPPQRDRAMERSAMAREMYRL
jgi:hypothetical protein